MIGIKSTGTSMSAVRYPRYPWKLWFARRTFTLLRGSDYRCRTYSMAQTVRNAAARMRVRVAVKILAGEMGVVVRVHPLNQRAGTNGKRRSRA